MEGGSEVGADAGEGYVEGLGLGFGEAATGMGLTGGAGADGLDLYGDGLLVDGDDSAGMGHT